MAKKLTLDEFLAMVKQVYETLPDSEAEKYGAKAQSTTIGNDYHKDMTKYVSRQAILDAASWVNRSVQKNPWIDYNGGGEGCDPHKLTKGGFAYNQTIVGVTPEVVFNALLKQFVEMDKAIAKEHKEYKIHSYGLVSDTHYDYDDASSEMNLVIYYSTPATYAEALQQAQGKLYQVQSTWRAEAEKRLAAITVAQRAAEQKAKEEEAAKKAEEKKKKEFDKMLKTIPKETLEALLAAKK